VREEREGKGGGREERPAVAAKGPNPVEIS